MSERQRVFEGIDWAKGKDRGYHVVMIGPDATPEDVQAFRDAYDLGVALADLATALPHKRWGVTLTGHWEDGWVATAWSSLVGGQGHIEVASTEDHWGYPTIGTDTPAAALRVVEAKLREAGR